MTDTGSDETTGPGSPSGEAPGDEVDEAIDEAGDESFPASDSPQWWSGS